MTAALILLAGAVPAAAAAGPNSETKLAGLTILAGLAWVALFILPFAPGILELLYPKDKMPLNINWNFVKDPFYFFKSFRALMQAKAYYFVKDSGTVEIQLSRPESVDVYRKMEGPEEGRYGNITYVKEAMTCGKNSFFSKEVYCLGNIDAGPGSSFRALGCDGELKLGAGSTVSRWAAAEGRLLAGAGSSLGVSAASSKSLTLADGCVFRSLFAPEIATEASAAFLPRFPLLEGAAELPPGHTEGNLVTRVPVRLKTGTHLNGSVKSHASVLLEDGVRVSGGIFAEGDVFIGKNCLIGGNIFAQGSALLGPGTVIGAPGGIKSVIAKKLVLLAGGVKVFGHINTQGRGEVIKI
jgi:hypothetical protein